MANWTKQEIRYLKECYGILTLRQIAAHLDRTPGAVSQRAASLKLTKSVVHKHSICWYCAKAVGGCYWSCSFEPVPGWTAKKTALRAFNNALTASYQVERCPEFKPDERRSYYENRRNQSN